MRIEQLECLAEVARLGSFRRAAEELHISQPALSGSVRGLERELGIDLLERGRQGATVSDAGRELLPHILSVLDSVDRLRQAAGEQRRGRAATGSQGKVAAGSVGGQITMAVAG